MSVKTTLETLTASVNQYEKRIKEPLKHDSDVFLTWLRGRTDGFKQVIEFLQEDLKNEK